MDLIHQLPSGTHYNTFILIFDKVSGNAKVQYMLVDPGKKARVVPKVTSVNMPRLKDRTGFRAVVYDNCLYIIGGKDRESGTCMNTMYKFDPERNTWIRKASMIRARTRFTVDAIGGNLIVTGGEVRNGKLTDSVEVYDPVDNIWAEVSPLPRPRADHGSCVVDGKLLVSGGLSNIKFQCSNVFWMYDPKTDRWRESVKGGFLPQERDKHVMVTTAKKQIYLVGGVTVDKKTKKKEEGSICCYEWDPKHAGTWVTSLPAMFHPRSQCGVVPLGHRLYVIGGHTFEDDRNVTMIEYYNMKKRKWYECFPLDAEGLYDVDVCVLRVPFENKEFSSLGICMYDRWILW
ncbi:kelch-like protein 9 [Lingula anatina]|uniref:Kelch-like protein 9 n=1 Tax=Lingula anatina TaxID=7574 RepID=A0A1S3JBG7_LINAN|nr:kelch-like protein 9 [Lingula anatina]XP_013407673.1 kelch-like protein 9 [Lingula anatina]|eukprot:XP_013407672.1 kelch-like protein 9 [Lingula anatina]